METANVELLNRATEILSNSGAQAITEYSKWFIIQSWAYVVVGIGLFVWIYLLSSGKHLGLLLL